MVHAGISGRYKVLALCLGMSVIAGSGYGHDVNSQRYLDYMLGPLRKLDTTMNQWRFSFLKNGDLVHEETSSDPQPAVGLRYASHPVYGNHDVVTLDIPLPDGATPKRVKLDQPILLTVDVDPDAVPRLKAEGESNILVQIEPILTENGDLTFQFKNQVEAGEPIRMTLTVPSLEALNHKSWSKVEINGVSGDRLRLIKSSSKDGSLIVRGNVNNLNVVADRGMVNLEGLSVNDELLLRAGKGAVVRVNTEGAVFQASLDKQSYVCYVGERPREIIPIPSNGGYAVVPCPRLETDDISGNE